MLSTTSICQWLLPLSAYLLDFHFLEFFQHPVLKQISYEVIKKTNVFCSRMKGGILCHVFALWLSLCKTLFWINPNFVNKLWSHIFSLLAYVIAIYLTFVLDTTTSLYLCHPTNSCSTNNENVTCATSLVINFTSKVCIYITLYF